MSFPVDYTTTIDGVTIKCSKTFDQLGTITADDLREYAIAGVYDIAVGRAGISCESLSNGDKVKANTPVEYTAVSWDDVRVNFNDGNYNPAVTMPHYGFTILVYGTQGQNIRSTSNDSRLVLDVPVQDIYADMPALTTSTITKQNDSDISDENSITVYNTDSSGIIKTLANNNNTLIHAMNVYVYDNTNFFIFPASFTGGFDFIHTTYIWGGNYSGASGVLSGTVSIQPYYASTYDGQSAIYANMCDTSEQAGMVISSLDWTKSITVILDTGEHEKEQSDAYLVFTYTGMYGSPSFTGYMTFYPKTERQCYLGFANSALKFRSDNTMYKPVIVDGVVIDYTDDMDDPSEFDDITTVTGNNVPVTPPAPPISDEDNTDVIPTVEAPYATGLAHYYITTAGSLVLKHISAALGTWDIENTHKDLYKNLISCKLIKPPTAVPSASGTFEIYGEKPQYEGADITIPEVTGNPSISFGPYSIPRKFDDFRDYAPYSKAEIFLPYCGWTALPSHVIGRSVSVTYYTDIIAATCKAIVYCGENVVAEAAGVIGLDIPFAADNVGAKMQAVNTGLLAYGKAALETAIGVGTAVATKGKAGVKNIVSGASGLASAYSQTAMAFNENWTEINGKNGDGCSIAGISSIVIKITRPKKGLYKDEPYVPSGYAHATGFLAQKKVTVSSVSGLLVCENPDVSGISGATDSERAEIRAVLESGLIVNSPPE